MYRLSEDTDFIKPFSFAGIEIKERDKRGINTVIEKFISLQSL